MKTAEKTVQSDRQTATCLARSVVDTLAHEPGLEAVTIDHEHEKISVAIMGPMQPGEIDTLTRRVTEKIHDAMENHSCGLLEGTTTCDRCETPLSASERRNVVIRRENGSTTISRATCP